jgi:hypothetical protein
VPLDQVTLSAGETDRYLQNVFAETFAKEADKLSMAKKPPAEELKNLPLAKIEVDDEQMHTLAQQRALPARDYLLASKKVEPARISLLEPKTEKSEGGDIKTLWGNRVDLKIK